MDTQHTWWEVEPFWDRGRLRYHLVAKSDGTQPPDPGMLGYPSKSTWRFRGPAQRTADRINLP